jgi:lipopolysaccharide assembly outer membrane protein LptD (OstA)
MIVKYKTLSRIALWTLVFVLVASGSLMAAEVEEGQVPARIEAKELKVDHQAKMAYGTGDVVLRHKDMTIRADKGRYNMATEEVWVEGNVRLSRQGQEWVTDSAIYNLKTRMVKADAARGMFDAFVVRGNNIQPVGTNHYNFARGSVTTCDYEDPHYRLEASHGEIWPGERIVLYNVKVRVGNMTVFWFPMVSWSLKDKQSPVSVSIGDGSRMGFFVLTEAQFPINKNLSATVHLDERTSRGPAGGLDVDYYYAPAQGKVSGYFMRDNDPIDEVDRALGKTIPRNRYRFDWLHKEMIESKDIDITARLTKQSDTDFMDDFYRKQFQAEGEPGSIVDVTKRGENYTLSATLQPQLNSFYAEVERMPEAKWTVNRVRIGQTPLFYEGETSAGYYHNVIGNSSETIFSGSSTRADTFHQLVLPQKYFGWLSVVPRAGVRGTYYLNAPEGASNTNEIRRLMLNAGMETSFKLSRTWSDVESKLWDIHGLRHIIEPYLDYQWVASPNVSSQDLLQFDTYRYARLWQGGRMLTSRYTAFDFPANSAIDALGRQNAVRFGVRQRLQTERNGTAWDLVEMDGWTEWNLEQTAMARDFSDFFGVLKLAPFSWLSVETGARYGINDSALKEFNTDATVTQGRWSVTASTRFLENDSNIVGGRVSYRLTRHWTAVISQGFDMQDGAWLSQDYSLEQETHDWIFSYGISRIERRIGDNETMFFFAISLKAFPSTKLGMRPGAG